MFNLVIIQNNSSRAIYAYDTYDAALAAFHAEMAYRADGRDSTVCVILNRIGELVKREDWHREIIPVENVVEEPEEISEPEEPIED